MAQKQTNDILLKRNPANAQVRNKILPMPMEENKTLPKMTWCPSLPQMVTGPSLICSWILLNVVIRVYECQLTMHWPILTWLTIAFPCVKSYKSLFKKAIVMKDYMLWLFNIYIVLYNPSISLLFPCHFYNDFIMTPTISLPDPECYSSVNQNETVPSSCHMPCWLKGYKVLIYTELK